MLIRTTEPEREPLELEDARRHLRIDSDFEDDDGLIGLLIAMARQAAEKETQRTLITTEYRLVLDCFPCGIIELDKGKVQSIDAIQYRDTSGAWQTLASQYYASDLSGCPGRVMPAYGTVWPPTYPEIGSVRIDYTAGYGLTSTDVPAGIRQWMLMLIGSAYANRETVAMVRTGKLEELPFVGGLLDAYRVELA